jgi:hypothetical protein
MRKINNKVHNNLQIIGIILIVCKIILKCYFLKFYQILKLQSYPYCDSIFFLLLTTTNPMPYLLNHTFLKNKYIKIIVEFGKVILLSYIEH